jgi:hypothetical protein
VPEVITHGVTGLIGETDEELADLCDRVHNISREACRAEAILRFSPQAMADGYEAAYRRVMTDGRQEPKPINGLNRHRGQRRRGAHARTGLAR